MHISKDKFHLIISRHNQAVEKAAKIIITGGLLARELNVVMILLRLKQICDVLNIKDAKSKIMQYTW